MTSRPTLGPWFSNFFEPFYSDREAVRSGIAEAVDHGFTSLNLDFAQRALGGEDSWDSMPHRRILLNTDHDYCHSFVLRPLDGGEANVAKLARQSIVW